MLGRLADATAAPTSAGSDDYYTIDDVKEYQIGLWTAIAHKPPARSGLAGQRCRI